ncbi:Uncharacterised protein [Mycobacteroides abscessus]|nr:Uncharacterised protein [Mycobacteroides abscessus]
MPERAGSCGTNPSRRYSTFAARPLKGESAGGTPSAFSLRTAYASSSWPARRPCRHALTRNGVAGSPVMMFVSTVP